MAPGFWQKVGNFFKKVGTGVVNVMRKAKEIGAKGLLAAAPIISKVPIVGSVVNAIKPAIEYTANNGGRTLLSPLDKLADRFLTGPPRQQEQDAEG